MRTLTGFVRNTFFNGWHPVIPWVSFVLFGMLLSRLKLQTRRIQFGLIMIGSFAAMTLQLASNQIAEIVYELDPGLSYFFLTQSIPPGPFFISSNMATASAMIGLCLWFEPVLRRSGIARFLAQSGRMALTLYVAHIYLGLIFVDPGHANRSACSLTALILLLAFVSYPFSSHWFGRDASRAGLWKQLCGACPLLEYQYSGPRSRGSTSNIQCAFLDDHDRLRMRLMFGIGN